MFVPATRRKLKLRMAICSPAGYGKSYTGLVFAKTLAEIFKTKIAAIDTEYGSLKKHIGHAITVPFDVCEPSHFAPSALTAILREAGAQGYGVVLIDGLSPFWAGKGGALQQVDDKKAAAGGNSFAAWKDVSPQHAEMIEAILSYPGHVIATMRTKAEYILEEETRAGGRKVMVPKKVGMAPIQREGLDYEFDICCDLDESHTLIVGKTRCPAIDGQRVVKPGPEFLTPVIAWLGEGTDAPPVPTFVPSAGGTAAPAAAGAGTSTVAGQNLASDVQVSEITVAIQALELKGQPAGMCQKRGVPRLEDLTRAQADEILVTLRAKVQARKVELDRQLAEAEKAKPANSTVAGRVAGQPSIDSATVHGPASGVTTSPSSPDPTKSTPTGNGSSNSGNASSGHSNGNASAMVGVENFPIPERPDQDDGPDALDQVGSILPDDEKQILAYCHKLMIGDADLARILAKRMQGNPPHPTRCVADLTYTHAVEILENLKAALAKRFPDQAPF
jgi:hypothetical protein